MEKQQDTTLVKDRSYRNVLTTGFRSYMEQFRLFFLKSWLIALVMAIVYGTLGALALIFYPATPLALILLAAMPLVLPALYAVIRQLIKQQRQFWDAPKVSLKIKLRRMGLLLTVLLSSILLVMLVGAIIMTPAFILCLANLQALQGVIMGDPSGMPSYITLLTMVTFIVTAFAQFYVSQVILVHYCYACGSIAAREADRLKQKIMI